MIPRHIYQTYHSRDIPAALAANVQQLVDANPGWKHQLFDDHDIERFIGQHYGSAMLSKYQRIDASYGAIRADLFRYLLMYRSGGVYLDIKSCATRPLDAVLRPDDQFILSHWENGQGQQFDGWGVHPVLAKYPRGEFQQWHIIAAPGHPFLKAVIGRVLRHMELYHPLVHGYGKKAGIWVTGPVPYTLAITPLLPLHPHRLVEARTDLGLAYSFLGASPQAHQSLFKSHYSQSSRPVVRMRWWMKAVTPVIQAGLKAGRASRRLKPGA